MRAGRPAGEYRRRIGFDGHTLERRLLRLHDFTDPGDGAAGANAGDQDVSTPFGVAPDFLGSGATMHLGVGGVFKLLRNEVARISGRHLHRFFDRTGHALGAGGQHQFGAVSAQHHTPLLAHGVGHDDGAFVTARRAHHRNADAGVAAGRFENDGVGFDAAGFFRGLDHRQADAVFHAGAGVLELELRHHLTGTTCGDAVDTHERRVADQRGDAVGYFHVELPGKFLTAGPRPRTINHCFCKFTSRATFAHLARSRCTTAANSSGVPPTGSAPIAANWLRTSAALTALTISRCN